MSLPDIKTQIKNIREEAINLGYSISTIDGYEYIWDKYIKWKGQNKFIYDANEYSKFLLECYNFDTQKYTNKSKSYHQQLMRSKRILDNFDDYKIKKMKEMFPKSYHINFPVEWNVILESYIVYLKEVRQNSIKSINIKQRYLERELSYFHSHGLNSLNDFSQVFINSYINDTLTAGNISKRRNFYVLKDFLTYLFIEGIIGNDLSIYIPKIKSISRRKLPTYIKPEKIEELINNIPRNRSIEKRNYTIILIAARLGLRINDILNIQFKDIDWKNNKLSVFQTKNNNLNQLPLLRDVGWAIIDYIKVRPKCENTYLFIKHKYPFEKLNRFQEFNKYFEKVDIETNENNKKGIHNLRHSLAKNMLDNDIPLDIISSTLGDTRETVSNTYLKIDIKNLKKCTLEVKK